MNSSKLMKHFKKNLLFYIICIISLLTIYFLYTNILKNNFNEKTSSEEFKLDNINTSAENLMIVAHPDDETFWGSRELYYKKYLVVCITCGTDKNRVKEFTKVMKITGDDYIMLGYPDLVNGKRSNWQKEYKNIEEDIKKIIKLREWNLIVTHNPDGEYGHIHHKNTNRIVTNNANLNNLYYFGLFYYDNIPKNLNKLTKEEYKFKKEKLLSVYKSQKHVVKDFKNIIPYENIIRYDEWYDEKIEKYY